MGGTWSLCLGSSKQGPHLAHFVGIKSTAQADAAISLRDMRGCRLIAGISKQHLLLQHVTFLLAFGVGVVHLPFSRAAILSGAVGIAAKVGDHSGHAEPRPSLNVVGSKGATVSVAWPTGDVIGLQGSAAVRGMSSSLLAWPLPGQMGPESWSNTPAPDVHLTPHVQRR